MNESKNYNTDLTQYSNKYIIYFILQSRVQFNDILTSTFEYPSEASLIVDEDTLHSPYAYTDNSLISNYENLMLEETDSPAKQHHHHHVVVDEIIQLPIPTANYSTQIQNVANNVSTSSNNIAATTTATTITTNTPTKNVLGNLPLDCPNSTKGITSVAAATTTTTILEKPKRPTNLAIASMQTLKPKVNKIRENAEHLTATAMKLSLINSVDSAAAAAVAEEIAKTTIANDDPVFEITNKCEIANIKQTLPLLPHIYKPFILHAKIYNNNNNNNIEKENESENTHEYANQRKTANVLNKSKYACFLQQQNNMTTTTTTVKPNVTAKRCKSFSSSNNNSEIARAKVSQAVALFDRISHAAAAIMPKEAINMRNEQVRHSFSSAQQLCKKQVQFASTTNIKNIAMDSSSTTNAAVYAKSRRRPTLSTASFNLSSASTALLNTRIPGNTLYYV